ncbi:hypothetical protein MPLB_1870078 [Mesorhizobium sp. ORS 3324]|nr:hypothetical protein MPLB_1870078 [Mesorhizobium sp. ORS 3324]
MRLIVTDKKHFGARLLKATGSADHLKQLTAFASANGFILKADGLYRRRKLIASATEAEIYEALGLQFVEHLHGTRLSPPATEARPCLAEFVKRT